MKFAFSAPLWGAVTACSLLLSSCDDTPETKTPAPAVGEVDLEFDSVVGSLPLALDGATYTNAAGNAFTVSRFDYYVSNIRLGRADGSEWREPESYHLVQTRVGNSQRFTLPQVPAGDYTRLTFTIGVDSARNVAGAQTGALDPNNDMFWSWNSGYVYTKLEGTSPQAAGGTLTFHVGGFRSPNNTIRTVSPALPAGVVLQVRPERTPQVHLKADVLGLFNGPTPARHIDFRTLSFTMGGANSVRVADNYAAGMFRIDHVHGN
jgi:hypothetical protein